MSNLFTGIQRIVIIGGGIAAIVAVIFSVLFQAGSQGPEIIVDVISSDELTKLPEDPNIKGSFTFGPDNVAVAHLWKVRVRFLHSGGKTLVGEGTQRNLIPDFLEFEFPEVVRILDIDEESNDFDGTLSLGNQNTLRLQFSQWRQGESLLASFFVASVLPLEMALTPEPRGRPIIDGVIRVQEISNKQPTMERNVLEILPARLAFAFKWFGVLVTAMLSLLFFLMIISFNSDFKKWKAWKSDYFEEFKSHMAGDANLTSLDQLVYLQSPWLAPPSVWDDFGGQRIPVNNPTIKSWASFILLQPIFLMFSIGPILLILASVP